MLLPSSSILLSLPLAGNVPPRLVFISGLPAIGSRYFWYKFIVDFVISLEMCPGFATKFERWEYTLLPLSPYGIFLFENWFLMLLLIVSKVFDESRRYYYYPFLTPVMCELSEIEQDAADMLTSRFCLLSSALTCRSFSIFSSYSLDWTSALKDAIHYSISAIL